jgi:hypothetical protein
MSPVAQAIVAVRQSADRVGLGELARVAGVPYTTVKSFADRGWENKNLEVLERLYAAAKALEGEASERPAGAA